MPLVLYVSHPQVVIDPAIPVPDWRLSPLGCSRLESVLKAQWVTRLQALMTSPERKAIETADMLATSSGASVTVSPSSAEIDRSSTGYVPHDEHERLADALFADPEKSASGWERAIDAQRRIVSAVGRFVSDHSHLDYIAIAGHGGVGTLLSCHLRRLPPARAHDQPHGGCAFAWRTDTGEMLFGWTPLEEVAAKLG